MALRVGIVGLGFGKEWARAMAWHPDAELVALCDSNCNAMEQIAEELEVCRKYDALEKLLESDDIVTGSFFDRKTERRGLALPREALEKIYYRNAVKIYPAVGETLKALGFPASSEE